jgi:hypothetical protein
MRAGCTPPTSGCSSDCRPFLGRFWCRPDKFAEPPAPHAACAPGGRPAGAGVCFPHRPPPLANRGPAGSRSVCAAGAPRESCP